MAFGQTVVDQGAFCDRGAQGNVPTVVVQPSGLEPVQAGCASGGSAANKIHRTCLSVLKGTTFKSSNKMGRCGDVAESDSQATAETSSNKIGASTFARKRGQNCISEVGGFWAYFEGDSPALPHTCLPALPRPGPTALLVEAAALSFAGSGPRITQALPVGPLPDRPMEQVWSRAKSQRESASVIADLESGDIAKIQMVCDGMRGHVCESLRHSHANPVLRQLLDVAPSESLDFVLDEVVSDVEVMHKAARHKNGCRVIEQFFGLPLSTSKLQHLVQLLLEEFHSLVRHEHGNWILQRVLTSGTSVQKRLIAERLKADISELALHHYGCRVVQKALFKGGACRDPVLSALLRKPALLVEAAKHKHGHLTMVGLLKLRSATKEVRVVKNVLKPVAAQLEQSDYGRVVLRHL